MKRIILFCLISRAVSEMRSMQHSMYITRKSRSNSAPMETGYVYSRVNSNPGEYATFGNSGSDHTLSYFSDTPVTKNSITSVETVGSYKIPTPSSTDYSQRPKQPIMTFTEAPVRNYDADYAIAKSNSGYESKYLPSKIRTDAMYEKLKSVMHYVPPPEVVSNMAAGFGGSNEYNIDDDDIRTTSRSSNLGSPYFYHSPYEYEVMKIDSQKEKAKDKRFAVDTIIPVHETVEESFPVVYEAPMPTPKYYREASTDNPMVGDEPFFSFVLNDYFDKNNLEDPIVFKGFDWGKDFDHDTEAKEYEDNDTSNIRLDAYFSPSIVIPDINNSRDYLKKDVTTADHGESVTEKGHNKKYEFDNREKGDEQKENHKTGYEENSQKYNRFKDFIDTFANKFGKDDYKRDSKYVLKRNQDKGEKKKGFHRVYHKDEYQEDNDFFDNTNNKAIAEEKGSSNAHRGGSEAILQSQAVAALGHEGNTYAKAGNTENNLFKNKHLGHRMDNGLEKHFNTYRDVAKKAALSNNADYTDH